MFRDDTSAVALFIDWDNLAISTAADLGNVIPGIVPDIGRIVKVAQRFGTVAVARAYSEWTSSTDRLTIYRAGVEPVYAPTFRFEPELAGQPHRGKSLADPCLVADCIDILHLMPEISVLVLVSGDKDLIPVVRLAQLRGKRVVVVGPDLSAAILKDMADEYISYRSLIEVPDTPAEPAQVVTRRRRSNGPVRTGSGAANVASSSTTIARSGPAPAAPSPISARPETPAPAAPPRQREAQVPQVAPPEPTPVTAVQPEAPATQEDPAPVFDLIRTILQDREARGRPRLRATNLKDQLLARISGFNERRYGFSRFKDFLAAAEKAGVLVVQDTGPVQWITQPTSPSATADAHDGDAVARVEPVEAAPTPSPNGGTPPHAPVDQPVLDEERGSEIVRFIVDLRSRSKWITFTYLLTNLVSHYEQTLPANHAESEARGVLNRLVQDGVLRVDRDPREIELGGVHHRVRLCHLQEEHPLVARVIAEMPTEPAEASTTDEPAASADAQDGADTTATPAAPTAETSVTEEARDSADTADSAASPVEVAPAPEVAQPAEVESSSEVSSEGSDVPTAVADDAAAPVATEASEADRPESDVSAGAEAEAPAEPSDNAAEEPMTLATAFARLREVVEATTSDEKPLAGAANIKTRLVRLLGAFDERSFGFGKFKDFLLAAEREGFVRVESSGPVTRIGLPISSGDDEAPDQS